MLAYILMPFLIFCLCAFEIERYKRKATVLSWYNIFKSPKSLMAPLNLFYHLISPNKAFLPLNVFASHLLLKNNIEIIQHEVKTLLDQNFILKDFGEIERYSKNLARQGWKSFFIKCYREVLPSAETLLPHTSALIKRCPEINLAMLSILEPGTVIKPHYGPSKLCYRYQLCLFCCNSNKAFINVDGEEYRWQKGEAIIFDDTYRHFAANPTTQLRIVLFCDIDRKLFFPFNYLNKFLIRMIARSRPIIRMNTRANNFCHFE